MDVRGKNFLVPFKVTENFSSYMGGGLLERGRVFLVHRREPAGEGTKGEFSLYIKGIWADMEFCPLKGMKKSRYTAV